MESIHYKILVVDDDEAVSKLIATVLSQRGHQCVTAGNGLEALGKITENKFNAVITDIVMPEMDGIALTKEVSNHYEHFPVMIMTGYDEYSVETAMASGAREFIHKPFSVSEFLVRFDKMMREHQRKETLRALSLTDELTNLYNRRRFFDLAEQNLKLATLIRRRSLLLYIDMDDLKWINDHCGHNEGDRALITLSNILKKTFRDSDIIARIGGDEFVILLESTDGNEKVVMTRLQENIRDHNNKLTIDYNLSVSIGAAPFDPEHPVSIDELLDKADASMYAHKGKRRRQELRTSGDEKEDFQTLVNTAWSSAQGRNGERYIRNPKRQCCPVQRLLVY